MSYTVVEHVLLRKNVTAPVKSKEYKTHPIWLTVYLFYWFAFIKRLWCSFSLTAISDPSYFQFCTMLCLSLSINTLFCFFLSLHSDSPLCFTCANSDKYSDDFMKQYHWINLIEWLFHLGGLLKIILSIAYFTTLPC
jgi:hypothetical protein